MSANDRRELVLASAARAFARGGYFGTSTDAVAREAGVSQPYVVRMFGSKAELFSEVFTRAADAIYNTFDARLDELDIDVDSPEFWHALGQSYSDLVADRDFLLVMMHGFVAGSTPEIGAQARSCLSRIYSLIQTRTGCEPEQARRFIADGMLINTLLAMQAPEHLEENDGLRELSICTFARVLDSVVP